ncbi:PDDEXK-like family protein [Acidiphilium sp. MT5]
MDAAFSAEPFANTDLDAGASPLHRGGAGYGAPSAILIGEAGTNLVLSWLQSLGIPAQIAMPGIAYDLIADVAGLDLLRIQVKTRSTPKGQSCSFNMTRGCYYSKAGMFNYGQDDFDLAAFVCLSIGAVFFCAGPVERISVRRAWMQSSTIARDSFDLALHAIQRRRYADQAAWLASMNDHASVLNFADDPAQKSASPVLPCPAPNPVPTLMPISTPIAAPIAAPVPSPVPAPLSASRPEAKLEPDLPQASEPKRRPVRMPAPPRVRPQKAPPPISPSQDALDAVDWDEALAMFDDHGDFDAIIPI